MIEKILNLLDEEFADIKVEGVNGKWHIDAMLTGSDEKNLSAVLTTAQLKRLIKKGLALAPNPVD